MVYPAFVEVVEEIAEQILGSHVAERTENEVLQNQLKPNLDQCFEGHSLNFQYWRELSGQGPRFLDVRYDPLYDESGRVEGVISGVLDITDIIHNKESTRYSDARFKDFAETAADWFWETDVQHRFTFLSQRFKEATRLPAEQVIARQFEQALPGQLSLSVSSREGMQNFHKQQSFKIDYTIDQDDGDLQVIVVSGKPMFDASGDIAGFRGTGHDITDIRKMSGRIEYQARHDALTGLINRYEFECQLELCLLGAVSKTSEHALCYMNLDQFKVINDTCVRITGSTYCLYGS